MQLGIRGANMGSHALEYLQIGSQRWCQTLNPRPIWGLRWSHTRAPQELVVPHSRSSELLTCGSAVMLAVALCRRQPSACTRSSGSSASETLRLMIWRSESGDLRVWIPDRETDLEIPGSEIIHFGWFLLVCVSYISLWPRLPNRCSGPEPLI